ncbi:MAG: hypothetical protein ABSB78_05585 [Bacteroidota bacterium]
MSSDDLKYKANRLALENGSKHELIRVLIVKGFLDSPKDTQTLLREIKHTIGKKLKSIEIQTYMRKFMEAGIVQAIHHEGHRGNYWVLASVRKDVALRQIGKGENVLKLEESLFSDQLLTRVGKDFEIEFEDLGHNFWKSGTCTSFMLRKILEKLIFVSFAKHNLEYKLDDRTRPGFYVGLESMIHLASSEKVNGTPFLTGRTAKEIRGIKFLGDAAAHNPLTNVDMKTIIPQMPFIITAFEELSMKL